MRPRDESVRRSPGAGLRASLGRSFVEVLVASPTRGGGCVALIEPVTSGVPTDVGGVDLGALAVVLQRSFGVSPRGYRRGLSTLRDLVTIYVACSDAEAEDIVERMIGRGLLRFEGDPTSVADRD